MKREINKLMLCLLVLAIFLIPTSSVNYETKEIEINNMSSNTATLNGGWVEERDGVTILHISGSNYEMGYQHGSLLKEKIDENSRAYTAFAELFNISIESMVDVWNMMKDYVPQEYKDEMQGLADGAGYTFEDVAVTHIAFEIIHCCGMAAWGPATADGKLIHMRSGDWSTPFQDPETGKYTYENQVLVVRKPENGYSSLYPTTAGFVICDGLGMNEKGISLGLKTSYSDDETFYGIPTWFRMQMVLDYAATAEEALNILDTHKTCGWNFIVADGNVPIGYAVEQCANNAYVGTWDDPIESTSPCYSMDHIVRRTNFFVHPDLAATQRYEYNPLSFPRWVMWKLGIIDKDTYFVEYYHYKALSEGMQKQWGTLDLNSAMSILRDVYTYNTDVMWWKIVDKIFDVVYRLDIFFALHQWVACPETGDLLISFANHDEKACACPVHYFNMFELLEAEPPP
jgi:hypothetical protein